MSDAVDTYDFRRPNQLADDIEHLLEKWSHGFVKTAKQRIADVFGFELEMREGAISTLQLSDLLEPEEKPQPEATAEAEGDQEAEEEATAEDESESDEKAESEDEGETPAGSNLVMQHQIGDSGVCWFTMPRPVILSMFAQILGKPFESLPEDRPLSGIEESLFESFTSELQVAMVESQPCEAALPCDITGLPKYEQLGTVFPESEQIVSIDFDLEGNFESSSFRWLLSNEAVLHFITRVTEELNRSKDPRPELERLIHQIPMNVVVNLGRTQLSWSELTDLTVGDVIKLNQRVSEPLEAVIAKHKLFRGWAGRHGNSHAFRITELVQPKAS
ncbi:MAG: FliM/FliN family flagellar motor switch protein [Planctomycetales bacterium]|nr:FliM/FliN family flagellar motor switch protein [Planctomycetales bacterium]